MYDANAPVAYHKDETTYTNLNQERPIKAQEGADKPRIGIGCDAAPHSTCAPNRATGGSVTDAERTLN